MDTGLGTRATGQTNPTTGTGSGTSQARPPVQAVVMNTEPNAAYQPFKEKGLATRAVKDYCRLNNIDWPKNCGPGKRFPHL